MAAGVRAEWRSTRGRLLAAQSGDREAQSEIFAEYRERVARQILRMTGDPAIVDDLVQEVFLSAFLALPGFRGDAQLTTWLYTITRNKVRSWWESRRRRQAREVAHSSTRAALEDTPEEDLMIAQQRDRFYVELGRLPDKLREAFVARAVEGMSLSEAAEALRTPISTVSYRARRAEKLLCEALGLPWRGDES
ncbi:MAG: sigma-70 family RNA polymerase sigma factor [Nannocystaceae bacterium]